MKLSNTYSLIFSKIGYWAAILSNKSRLTTRIRWLNIWASGHRKKFFYISCSIFLLILICDLSTSYLFAVKDVSSDLLGLNELRNTSQIFDKMQQINRNNEMLKKQQAELVKVGNSLVNKIDSLHRLKNKTREDSLEIVLLYNKLEPINNYLNDVSKN